jgi:hypothetical protein
MVTFRSEVRIQINELFRVTVSADIGFFYCLELSSHFSGLRARSSIQSVLRSTTLP